jgi:hypothetical protein
MVLVDTRLGMMRGAKHKSGFELAVRLLQFAWR